MSSVVEVMNIRKKYPLYEKKRDKIREAFSVTGRKYHKDFEALKGISFSVEKGECVGIIGLNGSGKSTLLKILTGVVQPTAGEIRTNGKIAALLELGAGFNPEYTGMENIYLKNKLIGYIMYRKDGVTFEKLNLKLALFETVGDKPQEEPITKTNSLVPAIDISLILDAKSSDESCLPKISIVIT